MVRQRVTLKNVVSVLQLLYQKRWSCILFCSTYFICATVSRWIRFCVLIEALRPVWKCPRSSTAATYVDYEDRTFALRTSAPLDRWPRFTNYPEHSPLMWRGELSRIQYKRHRSAEFHFFMSYSMEQSAVCPRITRHVATESAGSPQICFCHYPQTPPPQKSNKRHFIRLSFYNVHSTVASVPSKNVLCSP